MIDRNDIANYAKRFTFVSNDGTIHSLFDIVWPIGITYVQYPQQESPMDLWGTFSTWKVINYDGAFFRAEGTNANTFIEKTGNLIKQGELVGSHSASITVTGGNHRHPYQFSNTHNNGPWDKPVAYDNSNASYTGWTDYSGDLSMSGTVSYTATENRPTNYTIRVWKRTA